MLNESFRPLANVDYGWIGKHAREQYAHAESAFKAIDDKAGSIMGYVGSSIGIVALGSVVGLTVNQLNPWIAVFAAPSLVLAGLALIFAALSRRPFDAAYPPTAAAAIERANLYPKPEEAEASLISIWHLATTLMQRATDKKTRWVASATWMFAIGVFCLLLPLGRAVYDKIPAATFSHLF